MIRRATLEDMDWLIDLAREKYGARYVNERTLPLIEKFLHAALTQAWVCVMRGDFGAGIMTLTRPVYLLDEGASGHLLFIASRSNKRMEGYTIARSLIGWAFSLGAECVHVSSGTEYDLAPFARRLGAVQAKPTYVITRPVAMEMAA